MADVRGIRVVAERDGRRAEREVESMEQVGQAVPEVRRQLQNEEGEDGEV